MTKWTKDQRAAIEARGSDLLLSAAAGSGKTTVLVERVLSLIEDGMDLDRMLIVTFSRAAAADMKEKLTRSLLARAQEKEAFARQVEKVERASVCTIHAYCGGILREHFVAAGVDPAFRVLDGPEEAQLKRRAMEETLEEALAETRGDAVSLLFGRDVEALGRLALGLFEFSQERPNPDGWLTNACADPVSMIPLWKEALAREAGRLAREAVMLTRYALSQAGKGPVEYIPALESDLAALEPLAEAKEYPALREGIAAFSPTRLKGFRAPKEETEEAEYRVALAREVKDLRDMRKRMLEKARDMLPEPESAASDIRMIAPSMRALVGLARAFAGKLWALKQDRVALSFSDMEHAALRALGDPRVAQAERARFDCVFVDEYQDVSDMQEAIIRRVAREGALFMVGDVKQSIYRFRHAQPGLFIDKYARFGRGEGGRLITLSENFRSRATVLNLVNRVFERAMRGEQAEIQYDEAARLNPGATFPGEDPCTRILLLDGAAEGEDEDVKRDEAQGALAAREIRALLKRGRIREAGGERAVRPRDIAVLSRTRGALDKCERKLREAGVACYLDNSEGYFDALEVRVMLSLMQAVENRRRDIALLNTLRSPIVGLTSTQLAQIRGEHPEGPYCEAVCEYAGGTDELAGKLRAFLAQLDRWRMLSRALPLGEWVNLLATESGYYAYVGGMPDGATRQGNLNLLGVYADQLEDAQPGGLTAFLDYVAEVGNSGDVGEAHALGEGDDVVQLMTVHKSKGLEFPIVIALGLDRDMAGGDKGGELRCHRLLGAGIFCHDPALGARRDTIARRAIRAAQQAEELEEEKRILYVMLTRAREQLILIGSVKSAREAAARWEMMAGGAAIAPRSYLDMIMPVVDEREEVSYRASDAGQAQESEAAAPEEPTEEEIEALRAAMTWRYPYTGEDLTPLKLTATGLTREITGPANVPDMARRPAFLSERAMTAAERGTLLHAALSALDLAAIRESGDLASELDRQIAAMREKNLLSQEPDRAPLMAFLKSDMGSRMLAARTVRREWPFNLRMSAREALGLESGAMVVVQGVIDCCFLEDGQWVLLDYKSDGLGEEELLDKYRAQVLLYKKALERITGIPVKQTALYSLRRGRAVDVREE